MLLVSVIAAYALAFVIRMLLPHDPEDRLLIDEFKRRLGIESGESR
jgi:hypothetical protein